MDQLLRPSEYEAIDARPRILPVDGPEFAPQQRLSDLEHHRLRAMMLPYVTEGPRRGPPNPRTKATVQPNAATWWSQSAADTLLTGMLPQHQPFRNDPIPRADLLLRVEETDDDFQLTRLLRQGGRRPLLYEIVEASLLERLPDSSVRGQGVEVWGGTDYMSALSDLADAMEMSLSDCARKFGIVSLPEHEGGWRFHPSLGFAKRK